MAGCILKLKLYVLVFLYDIINHRLLNINNGLHIHEFNHDPLMIAHQIGVRLLILDEQQTN